ncbi:citramalate synthase [Naumannella halotolerans]|uniref:citramalate synthase n=1 Tax=Naumannella halotolerans TaxID=993414 RepID=UPI00370DD51F
MTNIVDHSTVGLHGRATTAQPGTFHVYDTTLRDGAQQESMRLTVADKLRITGYLDELGVGWIEGGWPGANPNDTAFFAAAADELNLKNATLVAFGATRRAGVRAAEDPQVQALVDSLASTICLVAKSHRGHVERALRTTGEENLAMISDTVGFLVDQGRRVFLDCEHFFDGYRLDPDYALEVVRTASRAGAEVVVLCDTNGGMLPSWVHEIVSEVAKLEVPLGVHCHNDTGCAVANTLAAVDAGAIHVQGTINGYGERTGNADLIPVIANLELKYGWELLPEGRLAEATRISNAIAAVTNVVGSPRQPYVGASAFAHKAGLHASAIRIDPNLYQHIDPAVVGNGMRTLVSDMAGRANIQLKGSELGFDLSDRELAATVTGVVKEREARGYSYEAADASFALLLTEYVGERPAEAFTVDHWRIHSGADHTGRTVNEATVKLTANDETHLVVGEGNGPVNALDQALRRGLSMAYPRIADFELVDYKVRILDSTHGTDATTRVMIDTSDGERTWTTVGVGSNIIDASWEALVDSFRYGLLRA